MARVMADIGAGTGGPERVEIVTRGEGRRSFSAEKVRLVSETFQPGATVTAVPLRHGICTSLLHRWRRKARGEAPSRQVHLATDADTGRIVASALTDEDADDGARTGPLLDRIDGPVASFTADGAFDRDDVYAEVAARHPDTAVVVPPRASAVPSEAAEAAPTQRNAHLRCIAERGRMGWQKVSGCNWRTLVEADIARWKRAIGGGLRSGTDGRQRTEVAIAAGVLNRMLDLGRPEHVRIA